MVLGEAASGQQPVTGSPRTRVIAEAGVNHNGEVPLARRLIRAAAEAGADAVKFQTFNPEKVAAPSAAKAAYQRGATDASESQLAMLRRLALGREAHLDLMACCREHGIMFLSTPFDAESADLLEDLGVPLFKISSGDITNLPFLRHLARKGRPLLLSTGMSTLDEVGEAVRAIQAEGPADVTLLHCVSEYPAPLEQANLRALASMRQAFGLPVGFSDHTLGSEAALAAVALGACVIEKHFTQDRRMPGPDHRASLEPEELKRFVRQIRGVEAALGDGIKRPMPCEAANRPLVRRSLFATVDVPAGAVLTPDMIEARRPGTGISPAQSGSVVGRRTRRQVLKDQILDWSHFQ